MTTRVASVLLTLLLHATVSGLLLPAGCAAPAAAARCAPLAMKRGRAQGGGPKIGTGAKRKSQAEISQAKLLRAKRREASRRKQSNLVPLQRQADRHVELLKAGAPAWPVYVRQGTQGDEWLEVGHVSVDAASGASAAQAAQLHKRLILEHGLRLYPKLGMHRLTLECGVASGAPDGEPEALEQKADAAPLEACGFLGTADPTAGHFYDGGEASSSDPNARKVKLDRLGSDHRSKSAEEKSKNLGLRSSW